MLAKEEHPQALTSDEERFYRVDINPPNFYRWDNWKDLCWGTQLVAESPHGNGIADLAEEADLSAAYYQKPHPRKTVRLLTLGRKAASAVANGKQNEIPAELRTRRLMRLVTQGNVGAALMVIKDRTGYHPDPAQVNGSKAYRHQTYGTTYNL